MRQSPAGFRKTPFVGSATKASANRALKIEPLAPFRLDLTAWALRRRPHNAIDRWEESTYRRVVSIDDGPVALSVTQDGTREAPRLSAHLGARPIDPRSEGLVLRRMDGLLGLNVDLSAFAAMAASDPLLGPLAARMRGLKPPRFPTVFEALVNGVACQQLSLDVGIHLLNRLTAERGRPVPEDPDGMRGFPGPEELASAEPEEVKRLGFSYAKAARSSRPLERSPRAILTWRASSSSRMLRRSSVSPTCVVSVAGPRNTCCCVAWVGCMSSPATTSAHTTSSGASSTSTPTWTTTP